MSLQNVQLFRLIVKFRVQTNSFRNQNTFVPPFIAQGNKTFSQHVQNSTFLCYINFLVSSFLHTVIFTMICTERKSVLPPSKTQFLLPSANFLISPLITLEHTNLEKKPFINFIIKIFKKTLKAVTWLVLA